LESVNAFVDAAKGRAKTLTFVETENGASICGGYLDVVWAEGHVSGTGRRSFIFTLKNPLGVVPTKFAQKRTENVAYMRRDNTFCFGNQEGLVVWRGHAALCIGHTYEAPRQGMVLFSGEGGGSFHAARWELWEVI
jgi:hypothetical protein